MLGVPHLYGVGELREVVVYLCLFGSFVAEALVDLPVGRSIYNKDLFIWYIS